MDATSARRDRGRPPFSVAVVAVVTVGVAGSATVPPTLGSVEVPEAVVVTLRW
jgi:hypothetical protein